MTTMMQLGQAAQLVPGSMLYGDAATRIARVHTDTRSIAAGDLFVALKGERLDANTLLHEARTQGAAAVMCHAGLPAAWYPPGLPRLEVADTKQALAALATGWRTQWAHPLIAVTGSNGKTTVTQMLASILEAYAPAGASLATQGNFNNEIGVPLTLLRLRAHHHIAVVELGMNHPGEIAVLAAMAQPTVALVNNAQREHLEFMHTIDAVALENASVFHALPDSGHAIFPAQDAYSSLWHRIAGTRAVSTFSALPTSQADVVLETAQWIQGAWHVHARIPQAALHFRLAIAGRHNVKNALAAVACALSAGIDPSTITQGLEAFVPVKGRCRATQVHQQDREFTLVDDTYNANPDSMRAAMDVLADLPGPRLLVMGDMGEVGVNGPDFHAEAGRYARALGIEHVFALGQASIDTVREVPGARHFSDVDALNRAVQGVLTEVGSVLVKGSRFMRMERVVEALLATPSQRAATHAV